MKFTRFAWLILALPLTARADDWPQWLGPDRDAVWKETGILDKFPEGGPKVLWRKPAAMGYAGPAVANGKVYLAEFEAKEKVNLKDPKVNNSSNKSKVEGTERVRCLDAKTGDQLWQHADERTYQISYPGGPRCTPTVSGGKVYFLGAEGNLLCLDADKGDVLWAKDYKKDYGATTPLWGFAGHPVVDGQRLICVVGGDDALVVAFDKDSGKQLWKAGSASQPGYSTPAIIEAGGRKQVVVWSAESLISLNPENGEQFWAIELKPQFGMAIMTPRKLGDHLFAAGMGGKAVMVKLAADKPAATEVWRGTPKDAVYPVNMTPFLDGDTIYGVDTPGLLRAVEIATGKRLWETPEPVSGKKPVQTGTAFVVKNGDRYFLFNENGELVIAKLSPEKYEEISRAKILEPTNSSFGGHPVVWSHPAFANKCMFARNDQEIVCVSLAKE
ncbi:MAG: PQQ-binding-like beta-propeller repeat protein [Gemmataceae bacterium]